MPANTAARNAGIIISHVGCVTVGVIRFMVNIGIVTSMPNMFVNAVLVNADISVPYHPLRMFTVTPKATDVILSITPTMVL